MAPEPIITHTHMPRGQHQNTINNNQAPSESSYPMRESPGYQNKAEAEENDLRTNFMKIDDLQEEMNKCVDLCLHVHVYMEIIGQY